MATAKLTESSFPGWRERRQRIVEFTHINPSTCKQLVKAGICASRQLANRDCRRLAEQRRIRPVGFVLNDTGRPADFWGWWKVQHQCITHEKLITDAVIEMKPKDVIRGNQLEVDPRPDAIVTLDTEYLLELDRHTESKKQLAKRIAKLALVDKPVVWIAFTAPRLKLINALCAPLSDRVFFTSLKACGTSWKDYKGRVKVFQKQST